ncbi:MAG: hypothetical protein K0S32_1292 [Bacteroidetes bacterium]|jgi:hypothetical protein|nr:hypothetical protein [Bacteroidota bacterium]
MFLITYHCKPGKNYKGKPVAGAYVNCYIKRNKFEIADRISREHILKSDWIVKKLEDVSKINLSFYKTSNASGIEYYKQALIDKEVFVFYNYPKKKK